jgi:uncharacterized membrane protein
VADRRTAVRRPPSAAGLGPKPRLARPEPAQAVQPTQEPEDDYVEEDLVPKRPWRSTTLMILSFLGIGVSVYVTVLHYGKIPVVCTDTGGIDCQAVLTSPQSVFLGIPVPVYGLVFFIAAFVFSLPRLWHTTMWWVPWVRLIGATVGILFALRLIYEELFAVKKICLWCTSVHILTFFMFVIVVTGWEDATRYVIPRRASSKTA